MHGAEINLVSKNVVGAIFGRNVTPIILVGLVNKVSFSELSDEIFYIRPVFTKRWVYSKTFEPVGSQCPYLVKMLQMHPNPNGKE